VRDLGTVGRSVIERRDAVCVEWRDIGDGSIGVGDVMFRGPLVCITGSVEVVVVVIQ